jgi:2-(1,2-epoxy-1,2-dihydrophenyl)acetyl-CoA isomerase
MSEAAAPILLTIEAGVATLTLNRPAVLNALDVATAKAFLAAVEAIAASDAVRAILIRGEGRGFCAGGDVSQFTGGGDPEAAIDAIIKPLHAGLALLAGLPQPSVACLHGAVAGGGFSLALACDFAVAADNTKFTMVYARIGATPDASGSYHLVRAVGMKKAREIALLADAFDATEALRLGLVNRVVPVGEVEAQALALAQRLATGPTQAYGRTKALLDASAMNTLAEQLELERQTFAATTRTADFREGVAAFTEKRRARFVGR